MLLAVPLCSSTHSTSLAMYCSHCGAQAGGNFCSACGTRLLAVDTDDITSAASLDWTEEIDYERLARDPHVRGQLAAAAGRARPGLTGEQLLAVVDVCVPTGVSLGKLTEALLPIYDRMGIRTGTESNLAMSVPPGRALLAVLCGLVARGMELSGVEQQPDGCLLTAAVPSTVFSNRGEIAVTVAQHGGAIEIHAAVKIIGQLYDWGKSKRLLEDFFQELRRELAVYQSDPPRRTDAA